MSAPRTNIETQQRRHRGPIVGMIAVVIFAVGLLFLLFMNTARQGTPPDSNAPQIDGRTGEPTTPDPGDPTAPGDSGNTTLPGAPADAPIISEGDPPATPEGDLPPADPPSPGPDLPEEPLPG